MYMRLCLDSDLYMKILRSARNLMFFHFMLNRIILRSRKFSQNFLFYIYIFCIKWRRILFVKPIKPIKWMRLQNSIEQWQVFFFGYILSGGGGFETWTSLLQTSRNAIWPKRLLANVMRNSRSYS